MALAAAPPAWASVAARKGACRQRHQQPWPRWVRVVGRNRITRGRERAVRVDAPPGQSSYFTRKRQPSELDAWAAEVKAESGNADGPVENRDNRSRGARVGRQCQGAMVRTA